jgi:hypothetical protein
METVTVSPEFQVTIPEKAGKIVGLKVGHAV